MHVAGGSDTVLIALQGFVTAFLLLHDWIPLGRLNNLAAMRGEDSLGHRIWVTLLPAAPAAIGLYFSAERFGRPYPQWLWTLLWITYGLLLLGLLRAWWVPYLLATDKERAERYEVIFAGTHSFLPERNGITPNTLHVLFHAATVSVVGMLLLRSL
jgi:hypothetical protein